MWQALIKPVAGLVGNHLANKAEEKKAKHKAKMQVIENDAEWESKMADASANSWKDEFWTLIFGAILLGCFLPFTQEYVEKGFKFLDESTPSWFSTCLILCISASFGIKGASGAMKMFKK